jgi:hypothetical protein
VIPCRPKITTGDIVTHNVTPENLSGLDEKEKFYEGVVTPVDDHFEEFDPKEERAFVRFLFPHL